MEKVNYQKADIWIWTCPDCHKENIEEEEPLYIETLECSECLKTFEVGDEE